MFWIVETEINFVVGPFSSSDEAETWGDQHKHETGHEYKIKKVLCPGFGRQLIECVIYTAHNKDGSLQTHTVI